MQVKIQVQVPAAVNML